MRGGALGLFTAIGLLCGGRAVDCGNVLVTDVQRVLALNGLAGTTGKLAVPTFARALRRDRFFASALDMESCTAPSQLIKSIEERIEDAGTLTELGRHAEALRTVESMLPLAGEISGRAHALVALTLFYARQFERAAVQAEAALVRIGIEEADGSKGERPAHVRLLARP